MAHGLHASSPAPIRSNRPDLASDAIRSARGSRCLLPHGGAQRFEEGICNHFSAVVPGHDDLFLVNPYGYAFRELSASKLLICDFDGHVLDGEGEPEATAFYIHAEMHRRLPRAKVAFHTHMPYATALSMTEGDPDLGGPDRAQILRAHGGRSRLQRPRARQPRRRAHRFRRR